MRFLLGNKKLNALNFENICYLVESDLADGTSSIFGVL